MPKPESVQENETHKILWDFEIQVDHFIPARQPDLVIFNNKKNSVVPAEYRVKIKENKKKGKYLDLARELKNLWNMTVIPTVSNVLGTILKSLVKGLEAWEIGARTETIQITTLLRSA